MPWGSKQFANVHECGRRESNPRIKLGKLAGYHYITPADVVKLSFVPLFQANGFSLK